MYGPYNHGWMMFDGGIGLLFVLWMILIWGIPVLLVIALLKYLFFAKPRDKAEIDIRPEQKTPLDILKEAYARGDISRDEYLRKRDDLLEK